VAWDTFSTPRRNRHTVRELKPTHFALADLTLKDGTVYHFGDVAPLQSIRDREGNQIILTRTKITMGNITRIDSTSGRSIQLTYDNANRITQAVDNSGRTVSYTYDANGNLATLTDPKGGVTTYTYDSSHNMLTLKAASQLKSGSPMLADNRFAVGIIGLSLLGIRIVVLRTWRRAVQRIIHKAVSKRLCLTSMQRFKRGALSCQSYYVDLEGEGNGCPFGKSR